MFGMNPRTRKNAAKKTRSYDEQRAREKIAKEIRSGRADHARHAKKSAKRKVINDSWFREGDALDARQDRRMARIERNGKKLDPRTKQKYDLI